MTQQHIPSIIPIPTETIRSAKWTIDDCIDLMTLVCFALNSDGDFPVAQAGAARALNTATSSLYDVKELLEKTGVCKNSQTESTAILATPAYFLDSALSDQTKCLNHLSFEIDRFLISGTPEKQAAWQHLRNIKNELDLVAKAIGRPAPCAQLTPEDPPHETETPPNH